MDPFDTCSLAGDIGVMERIVLLDVHNINKNQIDIYRIYILKNAPKIQKYDFQND